VPLRGVNALQRLTLLVTLSLVVVVAGETRAAGAAQQMERETPQVVCGALTPVHPRTGQSVRVSADFDGAEATLTGTYGDALPSELSKASLTLTERGRAVFSEAVAKGSDFFRDAASLGPFQVYASATNTPRGSLCVARLARGQQPTVLLDLYSGGAHCCTVLYGYRFGSPVHRLTEIDLGNPLAELAFEGGSFVIVTADNSFAYAFASFAGSGMPVKVLSFDGTSFTNVTRDYLGIVAEDANTWQSGYYQDPSSATGLIAAWVADEDLLGRSSSAWAFVENAVRTGQMKVKPWFKSAAAYLDALRALLVKDGYQPA
jgi:hypothetical protein